MFVLDTDHVSFLEAPISREAERIRARMEETGEVPATTIITYEEQTRGWFSYAARARKLVHEVDAYRRLARHLDNYRLLQVLEFNEAAAVRYQNLCRAYPRIGKMDKKIAAIVLSVGATLLTRNKQDFGQITELQIEDWTK
jgi:tRNA(fMet)-specific endonuclease VapC